MDCNEFIQKSGIFVRNSYFESGILPLMRAFSALRMSEDEFFKEVKSIISTATGARFIRVIDAGITVSTDDFYQMHEWTSDECTLSDLLNICDDTVGE